jgi:hypothetical protein
VLRSKASLVEMARSAAGPSSSTRRCVMYRRDSPGSSGKPTDPVQEDGLSSLSHAAVDAEFHAGDEAAFVAREKQGGGRDLFGPAEAAQRNELG